MLFIYLWADVLDSGRGGEFDNALLGNLLYGGNWEGGEAVLQSMM